MSFQTVARRCPMPAFICRRTILPAMLIAILAVLPACGTTEDNGETVRPTPISGETPGGGTALNIEARDFQFAERKYQVRRGQAAQIKLLNGGSAPHSFKAYEDDEYKEPVAGAEIQPVEPGQSGTTTLNPPEGTNELFFRCEVHPAMTGQIEIGV
jgi:hypothetical protein